MIILHTTVLSALMRRSEQLDQELNSRVIPFDIDAALSAAAIAARRYKAGRPVGLADTQIAGIAVSRGAAVATHNVRHFADLPIPVIDPSSVSG